MLKTLALVLLCSMAMAAPAFAQTSSDPMERTPIQAGLYQSAPMKINAPENPKNETHHLFLKVFPDHRVSMVISPASAKDVNRQFTENLDLAGNNIYSVTGDAISFNFGPTKHTVSLIKPSRVLLHSEYANGNINQKELKLVVPDGP